MSNPAPSHPKNFHLHADQGNNVVVTVAVTLGLATFFVALKLYSRLVLTRMAGIDDVFMFLALCCSIIMSAMMIEQRHYGLGRHMETLTMKDGMLIAKFFWASIPPYTFGLNLAKVSMIVNYVRIFKSQYKKTRIACWVILVVQLGHGISAIFAGIFFCTPVRFFWDRSIPGGHCLNSKALWFFNAAMNIFIDVVLFIIPIPSIKSLNLPTQQKYGVIIAFGVGLFACLVSILRLHALLVIADSKDVSWDNTKAAILSSIEINISIICASLPTIKPLLVRIFPRMKTISSRARTTTRGPPTNMAYSEEDLQTSRLEKLKRIITPKYTPTSSLRSINYNGGVDLEHGQLAEIMEDGEEEKYHPNRTTIPSRDPSGATNASAGRVLSSRDERCRESSGCDSTIRGDTGDEASVTESEKMLMRSAPEVEPTTPSSTSNHPRTPL